MDICESKGVNWPPPVPPELASNPWFLTAPQREREIICLACLENGKDADKDCQWVDTSQTATRARPSTNDSAPTVTPGCHLWHFPSQRYCTGKDLLRLQGYPLPQGSGLSDNQMADLAGNAFSSSVSLALDVALLLLVRREEDEGGSKACDFLRSILPSSTPEMRVESESHPPQECAVQEFEL